MAQAQIDLQTLSEPTSSDLTKQPLFNDSLVLFLEPLDQITTNPSDQIEQAEHTTSSNVHTPPDNTHETPPPPKKRYEIKILSWFLRLYFLLQYLLNFHVLQTVMII